MIIDQNKYVDRSEEDDLNDTIEFLTQLTVEYADIEFKKSLASYLLGLCDEGDEDDMFGTEGWRRHID
jgi:hypothetical protein